MSAFLRLYRQFFLGMLACLILLGILGATYYAGLPMGDRAWRVDCSSGQQHRAGGITYLCMKQEATR